VRLVDSIVSLVGLLVPIVAIVVGGAVAIATSGSPASRAHRQDRARHRSGCWAATELAMEILLEPLAELLLEAAMLAAAAV
jgi:hypothetical protein